MVKIRFLQMALWAILFRALVGCGGDLSEVTYVQTGQPVILAVTVSDQFGNRVPGVIRLDGVDVGIGEFELRLDLEEDEWLSFDPLPGYTTPAGIDLSKVEASQRLEVAYVRTGDVANVCVRAVNEEGLVVETPLFVNYAPVDPSTGCQAVDVTKDVDITGADAVFIPAQTLAVGQRYEYVVVLSDSTQYVYVATTPVKGEIFLNGRSLGWAKDDFLSVRIPMEGDATFSFGEMPGHQTAAPFTVDADDWSYKASHYWALYGADKHALVCFVGLQDGTHPTAGLVLVDGSTELDTGYDYPGCVGLGVLGTHSAEFLDWDNYQSTDVLAISAEKYVGCDGDFVPGGRLDCVGTYYYVQPTPNLTQFIVQVNFVGPFAGNLVYPIEGHYEVDGIQHEQMSFAQTLKPGEKVTLTLLPVGILQPDMLTLVVDASALSVNDPAYNPQYGQWVHTVVYAPPPGATEACVTSFNQNGVTVSSQVGMHFDGFRALNAWDAAEDCHWFAADGNHVIVPDWLQGYRPAVEEIHVPEGMISVKSSFQLPFVPDPTAHRLCIDGVTVEAELSLNGDFLGWTYFGTVCLWLDKSVPNTLKIEQKSRLYAAEDPALSGTNSNVQFANLFAN